MDRNPDRLYKARENFKKIGANFIRYAAVDGRQFTQEEFDAFAAARPRQAWSRGQMGCFLSHFQIWEIVANSTNEYAAIFEDDLELSPSLTHFLEETDWIPKNVDLIRLEVSTNRVLLSKVALSDYQGRKVLQVLSTTWCTGGYVLSRQAARKLIACPVEEHRSSDCFLFSYEESNVAQSLKIAQVFPALVIQVKFYQAGLRFAESASNISDSIEGNALVARIKYALKVSPFEIVRRTIKGYKRVPFCL